MHTSSGWTQTGLLSETICMFRSSEHNVTELADGSKGHHFTVANLDGCIASENNILVPRHHRYDVRD
jgi:hypothetical protein